MAEPQLIHTKHYGTLEVLESYQDGNLHIAKTPSGYVHMTGLPVKEKSELRQVIPASKLQEALDWWERRFEADRQKPRCIMLDPEGRLFFEDGTPVKSADEIDNSIKPGPAREAMRQAFYVQLARDQEEKAKAVRQEKRPSKKKPAAPAK